MLPTVIFATDILLIFNFKKRMRRVIAKKSVGCLLTKGMEYFMIREQGDNYIIIDNDGVELGFNKNWFDESLPFDAEKFAHSILRLMLFPKSENFTDEDIVKGKAFATLVIETVKGNCENEQELKQIEMIQKVIETIKNIDGLKI